MICHPHPHLLSTSLSFFLFFFFPFKHFSLHLEFRRRLFYYNNKKNDNNCVKIRKEKVKEKRKKKRERERERWPSFGFLDQCQRSSSSRADPRLFRKNTKEMAPEKMPSCSMFILSVFASFCLSLFLSLCWWCCRFIHRRLHFSPCGKTVNVAYIYLFDHARLF